MKAMENRSRDDLPGLLFEKRGKGRWVGNVLVKSLVRTTAIEEGDVLVDQTSGMALVENQNMIHIRAERCPENVHTTNWHAEPGAYNGEWYRA
jgi:hypothetical protein